MATTRSIEDMIRKVQAMLARADHPNTPVPEAETARNMAEALMFQYRIDVAMLASEDTDAPAASPQWSTFDICDVASEYRLHYRSIASDVIKHFACRGVVIRALDGEREVFRMHFVGYDAERRMAEAMYVSCMLAFQRKVEPKYDSNLSDQVNAYIMRSAGMEGWRIAQAIYGRDDKALRPKVRGMFKAEAMLRGEDPSILLGKGNSVKNFREDFATGFANEIFYRLERMRRSRGESGKALILASRDENVSKAFYDKYPQFRPTSGSAAPYTPPNHGCAKCKAAKTGYCRDHGYLRPRKTSAGRSTNLAAYERGTSAALAVDMGVGGTAKVDTSQPKEIG